MIQFAWHDGSTKNIHVDMTQLFEYQKQLREIVQLYERRVDWLASGSRRIFGTLVEKKWDMEMLKCLDRNIRELCLKTDSTIKQRKSRRKERKGIEKVDTGNGVQF